MVSQALRQIRDRESLRGQLVELTDEAAQVRFRAPLLEAVLSTRVHVERLNSKLIIS